MSPSIRKNSWQDQLWNVSLLPTVPRALAEESALGGSSCPQPLAGDRALGAPALLSLVLDASHEAPAEAA